ncbi:unnamed protein product, partial [marine sediment metagenome]
LPPNRRQNNGNIVQMSKNDAGFEHYVTIVRQ